MNKEEIYFKKTPVIEPPKEGSYITDLGETSYRERGKYWYRSGTLAHVVYPKWYLAPCSPPDEGAFAEWCNINGFRFSQPDKKWFLSSNVDSPDEWKTTSELYKLFTDQRK